MQLQVACLTSHYHHCGRTDLETIFGWRSSHFYSNIRYMLLTETLNILASIVIRNLKFDIQQCAIHTVNVFIE